MSHIWKQNKKLTHSLQKSNLVGGKGRSLSSRNYRSSHGGLKLPAMKEPSSSKHPISLPTHLHRGWHRGQWGEEGRQWAFTVGTVNACLPSFSVDWLSIRFVYFLIPRWIKAVQYSMNNFDSLNFSWFQVSLNLILKLRNSQTKSFIYGFTLAESYFSLFWLWHLLIWHLLLMFQT